MNKIRNSEWFWPVEIVITMGPTYSPVCHACQQLRYKTRNLADARQAARQHECKDLPDAS